MSRISRKSELSPSATGSNIDLGKNDGVDMGRKTQPSVTSGGLGVSTEITNIDGLSVTGGVSVDISPIDLGINYDPAENSVSVAGGAEIPGGFLGISGGATIDLNTGEIIGGSLGGEALGLGVNVSSSKEGGLGVELTIQIPGTPIELSLGFGFPPGEKEPTTPTPTPRPPGIFPTNPSEAPTLFEPIYPDIPVGTGEYCSVLFGISILNWTLYPGRRVELSVYQEFGNYNFVDGIAIVGGKGRNEEINLLSGVKSGDLIDNPEKRLDATRSSQPREPYYIGRTRYDNQAHATLISGLEGNIYAFIKSININQKYEIFGQPHVRQAFYNILGSNCSNNTPPPPPPPPPPPLSPRSFPNPPPRKRNKMNECCRDSIKLQRLIVRHLGAVRSSNQEILPDGVKGIGSTQDGIQQAYPFVVRKRWIDPNAKENEGIPILNDRQLALTLGGMIERLERVLGTAEFYKDSDKKLRQSEGNMLSWLTGKNKDFRYPDPNDFWLNTDDGVINEKTLEVRSIADGLRYQIEALNRLERILPIAELKDSSIPARWVYPKGKGQLRVGNLIHLVEYMFRADDRARGFWPQTVKIKDSNPAIPGDQSIELKFESQGDMLREILKLLIDTESDGDLTNNFALRSAIQQCQIHQGVVQTHAMVDAIVEYLDFKVNRTTTKVPMPFSPFAGHEPSLFDKFLTKLGFGNKQIPGSIDKNTEKAIESLFEGVLQNAEVEVPIIEADEKKSLSEALLEILKHASAASAAVSERVGEGALKRLVESAGIAQSISRFLLRKDIAASNGIGDLDQWIDSAEKGYTDKPETDSLRFPESNPLEPYDRPLGQNPKIREIDTKDPKAD